MQKYPYTETRMFSDVDDLNIPAQAVHEMLYAEVLHAQRLQDTALGLEAHFGDLHAEGYSPGDPAVTKSALEYREAQSEIQTERCKAVYEWYLDAVKRHGFYTIRVRYGHEGGEGHPSMPEPMYTEGA